LLSQESFEQLTQPQIATEDGLHGESYGLGIFIQDLGDHKVIGHSGGMVGYLAHLLADLDTGLGIIALTNSPYDPRPLVQLAWELLVAAMDGDEIPEMPLDDPYRVENLEDYVGRYRCDEKTFTLTPKGEHLHLEFEGDTVCLEPAGRDAFLVPHPFFELFALHFERTSLHSPAGGGTEGDAEDQITAALHGPDVYCREGTSGPPKIEISPDWHAYPGHYRSYNPWLSNFRVVLRQGKLILVEPKGGEEPLYPLEPGCFRVGKEPRSPEFLRFETIIDGKAQFASYSGGAYCRTFTR
jgi:hypothetical protein